MKRANRSYPPGPAVVLQNKDYRIVRKSVPPHHEKTVFLVEYARPDAMGDPGWQYAFSFTKTEMLTALESVHKVCPAFAALLESVYSERYVETKEANRP